MRGRDALHVGCSMIQCARHAGDLKRSAGSRLLVVIRCSSTSTSMACSSTPWGNFTESQWRRQNRVGAASGSTLEHFQTIRNLTFHDLGRAIGLSKRTAETFANDMFEQLRTTADRPRMFQGISEVLRQLAARHKLVVITANVRSAVERVLREADVLSAGADVPTVNSRVQRPIS